MPSTIPAHAARNLRGRDTVPQATTLADGVEATFIHEAGNVIETHQHKDEFREWPKI